MPSEEAGSASAEPTTRDVPAGQLHVTGPDQASSPASAAPSRTPATDTPAHGTTVPSAHNTAPVTPSSGVARTSETAARGKRETEPSSERSGKSRKAEEVHQKLARKKKED